MSPSESCNFEHVIEASCCESNSRASESDLQVSGLDAQLSGFGSWLDSCCDWSYLGSKLDSLELCSGMGWVTTTLAWSIEFCFRIPSDSFNSCPSVFPSAITFGGDSPLSTVYWYSTSLLEGWTALVSKFLFVSWKKFSES